MVGWCRRCLEVKTNESKKTKIEKINKRLNVNGSAEGDSCPAWRWLAIDIIIIIACFSPFMPSQS